MLSALSTEHGPGRARASFRQEYAPSSVACVDFAHTSSAERLAGACDEPSRIAFCEEVSCMACALHGQPILVVALKDIHRLSAGRCVSEDQRSICGVSECADELLCTYCVHNESEKHGDDYITSLSATSIRFPTTGLLEQAQCIPSSSPSLIMLVAAKMLSLSAPKELPAALIHISTSPSSVQSRVTMLPR